MISLIGWLGSVLLAYCGAPQALHSIRTKSSRGLTWPFLLTWFFGEIFSLIFILTKEDVGPLLLNYCANILFLGIIIYYKLGDSEDGN